MMKNELYPCVIEKSEINGNFTIWLPEQEGLIEWIEKKHSGPQGYLWHALIVAASEIKQIDITRVYIAPEADVFVAYSSDYSEVKKIAHIIKELISKKAYFLNVAEHAEAKLYFKKY